MDLPVTPPAIYREACIQNAAAQYQAHPNLIRAVIATEGGTTGKVTFNKNGTYDMGLMAINSVHLPELARYNITAAMLTNDECLNIMIGTYYLQSNIIAAGNLWRGTGNYHSKTPDKNAAYQQRVWSRLKVIQGGPP